MTVLGKKDITILVVSFNSSIHLKRLVDNFLFKTSQLDNVKFLIIDNTNGKDKSLYTVFDNFYEVRILKNKNRFKQRSLSHASALDFGLGHVDTQFTLIWYSFRSPWLHFGSIFRALWPRGPS